MADQVTNLVSVIKQKDVEISESKGATGHLAVTQKGLLLNQDQFPYLKVGSYLVMGLFGVALVTGGLNLPPSVSSFKFLVPTGLHTLLRTSKAYEQLDSSAGVIWFVKVVNDKTLVITVKPTDGSNETLASEFIGKASSQTQLCTLPVETILDVVATGAAAKANLLASLASII